MSEVSVNPRRWLILAVVGLAQLMVVLDATIVNIALPSAQIDLGFADDVRQWVISAYAIAFGALLLLGGRLGDEFGRRRLFVVGLIGFAVASALGGLAQSFELLIAARVLQGVFGALLAPAALSIVATTFTDPAERGKAFGVFSAVSGVGAGIGLLLGGVLTDLLSWRWCLLVNLAFALPAALGARMIARDEARSKSAKLDIPGALSVSLGLFLIVFGVSNAEQDGWSSPVTLSTLIGGLALLVLFVLIERKGSQPLLPLRVITDRARAGAYFAVAMLGVTIFGASLFLTFYLQQNLGYTPMRSGLAFMPMNLTILVVSGLTATKLLPRFGPRPLITAGLLLAGLASVIFAQMNADSGYAAVVLPGLIVAGVGAGLLFPTSFAVGTQGVDRHDAGVASATVNTAQQLGGSIGIALLSTIFADAVHASLVADPIQNPVLAAIDGYERMFWWAAGISLVSAVVAALLVRSPKPDVQQEKQNDVIQVHV
ncbi:MFS transporter [Kineosporia babensis]|uniref:MFS transporter n=1 Tax=Kineosporia babensis TaxID=499548 RepID=A0A9X1NHB1_9ACTN|nr:MFS transporter [Kineosporia babensis]MCD5314030.1 MFS transporter [Kineosporia babensis]